MRAGQVPARLERDGLYGVRGGLVLPRTGVDGAALSERHVPKLDGRHVSEQLLHVHSWELLSDWRNERDAVRGRHLLGGRRADL